MAEIGWPLIPREVLPAPVRRARLSRELPHVDDSQPETGRQLSIFGAETTEPSPADLAGLIAGPGRLDRMGGTARVSVPVDAAWRVHVLVNELVMRGLVVSWHPLPNPSRSSPSLGTAHQDHNSNGGPEWHAAGSSGPERPPNARRHASRTGIELDERHPEPIDYDIDPVDYYAESIDEPAGGVIGGRAASDLGGGRAIEGKRPGNAGLAAAHRRNAPIEAAAPDAAAPEAGTPEAGTPEAGAHEGGERSATAVGAPAAGEAGFRSGGDAVEPGGVGGGVGDDVTNETVAAAVGEADVAGAGDGAGSVEETTRGPGAIAVFQVRTAYSSRLNGLARSWPAAADRLFLSGPRLRLWVAAAGGPVEGGYALGLDPDEDSSAVDAALVRAGLAGAVSDDGRYYLIMGKRRLARLAELVGERPAEAPPALWPGGVGA